MDERELQGTFQVGGHAGAMMLSQGSAGANAAAGEANGGSAGEAARTIDGCADIDGNGIADCTETLAANSDFKSDIAGWTPGPGAKLAWDEQNAGGSLPSGSGLLVAEASGADGGGSLLREASQCLPVSGNRLVTVYANSLVQSGQDPLGHAEVDVSFFEFPACAGALTSSFSTPQPLEAPTGTWLDLKAGTVTSANTQSMSVRLAISKPAQADSYQARFDNILLKVQAL